MACFISEPDYNSPMWESIPGPHRKEIRDLLTILKQAPDTGVTRWMQETASMLGMSFQSFRGHYYNLLNNAGDWTVLVDKRKASHYRAAVALARQPLFMAELAKIVEEHQRNNTAAFRTLRKRWATRRVTIPGYETWPGWPKVPAGWTDGNLGKIVKDATNAARLRSIRVGTSSKTNTFLPTVLTTRTNLWPGAVIQLDDVWHTNFVTLGKKREVVRVLELGALDLFSACRFHFGAKPRRQRENKSWETIGGADMRMFLAGMFHQFGYSPSGTMLMSEHNTAKVSEDIARILYDSTHGMIRVDYQPIEGKQAALCGYWAGTEGGNFRAKACLESTHSLMHNDLGHLSMQTGHNSHGLQGPVTTDRIASYILRIVKSVLEKVPHREHLLRLPALDFHTQFYPFLVDYYQFGLNGRHDHDLEGWEALGHVISQYTTIPGSGQFFDEETFLKLPTPSQTAIRHAAAADPQSWSRRHKLSPLDVWEKRPKFTPIPPVVLCDILGGDLAREVTARRGFLEFSDQEIACDPLVYQARFVSGPNQGREIPHGEKVKMFILPFDDRTAMVVDSKERFLGEVPLYRRVTPINPAAFGSDAAFEERPEIRSQDLRDAAGEKHSRIADILEPSRILHADRVQDARDIREHNRKVLSGDPVTPDEITVARSESAQKGVRTAAANRLQQRGSAKDWDAFPASAASNPFDSLPDDEDLPEAF